MMQLNTSSPKNLLMSLLMSKRFWLVFFLCFIVGFCCGCSKTEEIGELDPNTCVSEVAYKRLGDIDNSSLSYTYLWKVEYLENDITYHFIIIQTQEGVTAIKLHEEAR